MQFNFQAFDYSVIVLYFVLVFLIAKSVSKKNESEDYFLAGRNLGWFAIGASLFASNIGSEHLIGLAGAGAKGGVAISHIEILAGIILLILGWMFVPFYLKSGVTTMPEFLEQRYGTAARKYLSFISIISYIITKISATIFAGAVVFESLGVSFWIGAVCTVLFTGIYTALGGLKAVIYTDVIQVVIMILGAIFVTYFGMQQLGGLNEFQETLPAHFFDMWKSIDHPEFPWTGIIFGAPILGIWYWCTDQFIVQRVLSAKNITNARKGSIFAGYLKILPLFLFVVPGMVAYALSLKGNFVLANPDSALPALVANVLPTGLKGLIMAGLLAALMSSLSSVFNSCSTLITFDWYKEMKPQATEKELLKVGQISTAVLVILGLLWIPMMKLVSGGLYTYIQSIQAYISPPIAAVFIFGLFFKKLNLKGAMASLGTGFLIGILRLILEINKDSLEGNLLYIANINFLHFAIIIFTASTLVLFLVSYLTITPNKDLSNLIYQNNFLEMHESQSSNFKKDIYLSIGLIISIISIWVWLS